MPSIKRFKVPRCRCDAEHIGVASVTVAWAFAIGVSIVVVSWLLSLFEDPQGMTDIRDFLKQVDNMEPDKEVLDAAVTFL